MDQVLIYIVVGFAAQLIDGALGMAYGVTSNTFLLSAGLPPKVASACVHMAEVFTTLVSGLSHLRFGNVDKALFQKLVIPGVIGGALGAYILTTIDESIIKPFVSVYLVVMGLMILRKAFTQAQEEHDIQTYVIPLAAAGGFMDAVGGGGWGPVVTSTMVARGHNPRLTIGSVNLSEFFVTAGESVMFLLTIGELLQAHGQVIVGLLVGGVIAAPLAAYVCNKISARALMVIVGVLVIVLNVRTLLQYL
ncbi:MAG: sulfite exporter TauE/SafE family protein [Anaerolineae bacterium]|nr:sulfite exporter TauE/SafE family protein [Anaerolineae bacterium]